MRWTGIAFVLLALLLPVAAVESTVVYADWVRVEVADGTVTIRVEVPSNISSVKVVAVAVINGSSAYELYRVYVLDMRGGENATITFSLPGNTTCIVKVFMWSDLLLTSYARNATWTSIGGTEYQVR